MMSKRIKERVLRLFWITLTGGIAIITIYTSIHTIGDMIQTNKKSAALDTHITKLEAKIASDSTFIEDMKNPEFLERYAREKYNMQREGETVYLTK